jgi:uncharacterized protein YdeI (YjbR/CyaY-like superfamily)
MRPIFFPSPAAFRAWLEAHHATQKELLVGFHKRATGKSSLTWQESVDEALCFGWIDGVRHSAGADAYTIRFTPRKPTSTWSAVNVGRVAALKKEGRMRPAGLAAFAARKAEKTATYSYEREHAKLSPAEERALRGDRAAAAFYDAQPPWYRRTSVYWVASAKKEQTRARRLARLIADSAAGRAISPLRRKPKG